MTRALSLLGRLLLGTIFLYAAIYKIADPPGFAKVIFGYRILPAEAVNLLALYLPWLELLVGLALIAGVWIRGASLLTAGMLGVFILAIGINLAQGNQLEDCGCFSHAAGPIQLFLEGIPGLGALVRFFYTAGGAWTTLARDVVLLAFALLSLALPVGWRPARAGRAPAPGAEKAPA